MYGSGVWAEWQVISYSIKSSHRERKQNVEIEKRLSALDMPVLLPSTLMTVKAIESRVIAYSLSQESLDNQTEAILLLDRVMNSMGSPDTKQLQDCVHTIWTLRSPSPRSSRRSSSHSCPFSPFRPFLCQNTPNRHRSPLPSRMRGTFCGRPFPASSARASGAFALPTQLRRRRRTRVLRHLTR